VFPRLRESARIAEIEKSRQTFPSKPKNLALRKKPWGDAIEKIGSAFSSSVQNQNPFLGYWQKALRNVVLGSSEPVHYRIVGILELVLPKIKVDLLHVGRAPTIRRVHQ
jgi:hypothetical protein